MTEPKFVKAMTYHERRGGPVNAFRYGVDMALLPIDRPMKSACKFFAVDASNLFSFWRKDHGFGEVDSYDWARGVIAKYSLEHICDGETWLFAQPRCAGYSFNPVSFWFFKDRSGAIRAVIAEVNNTFGDRHAYLCRHQDARPIQQSDRLTAEKVFHVSPFQEIAGTYEFRFHFDKSRIGAWIDFRDGDRGLFASVTGEIKEMTDRALLLSALMRPFGALRVAALIYWQAFKLKLKGARYIRRPAPPTEQVTL